MTPPLRALLVSYSFPPVGGAGVQRVVKLAKYLPEHGVRPAVLTVANPSVPLRDESLLRDVPPGVEVTRARTLEPGYAAKTTAWRAEAGRASARASNGSAAPRNCGVAAGARGGASRPSSLASVGERARDGFGALLDATRARAIRAAAAVAKDVLFPDPQVLWQPAAQSVLARRVLARQDDVVLVSAPPFSQFLLGPLARVAGVGVVLDYRDEWTTLRSAYEMNGSRISRALADPLEAALLRRAHAVVTATEEFRANLLERFPFLDGGRVVAIPNGYDEDDFPAELEAPPTDRFVISYAGTVFALTSMRGLLAAIRLLHDRSEALARLLRLRVIGRIVDTEADAFEGSEALGVERIGYVPHGDVLRRLSASHMTSCVLDAVPGVERIYPAKIFELMRLGRPVLTLAPSDSALARLVTRHSLGPVLAPRDAQAIARELEARIDGFRRGDPAVAAWQNAPEIDRYDRRALAGEFAEIMRAAVSAAGRRAS